MNIIPTIKDPYADFDTTTHTKQGSIARALTLNDIFFWGGISFVGVVITLFIVTFIEGATVEHVGIAFMIRLLARAIFALPVGRFFDKYKGYADEIWALSFAASIFGLLHVVLGFSTEIWQLYSIMFFLGVLEAVDSSSWRILFYGNISRTFLGKINGVYDMFYSVGSALCLVLGGYVAASIGYDKTVIVGGLFIMVGGFLPLLIRGYLSKKELKGSK